MDWKTDLWYQFKWLYSVPLSVCHALHWQLYDISAQEHNMPFHLFSTAFVCFKPVLRLHSPRSFIFPVTSILWNWNLFWCFLIDCCLHIWKYFCMLILYLATWINHFIVHSHLYCIFVRMRIYLLVSQLWQWWVKHSGGFLFWYMLPNCFLSVMYLFIPLKRAIK